MAAAYEESLKTWRRAEMDISEVRRLSTSLRALAYIALQAPNHLDPTGVTATSKPKALSIPTN